MHTWSPAACAIAALAFVLASSCANRTPAVLSERKATLLAVRLANDEAVRLFDIKPFDASHSEMQRATNGWAWRALVGYGRADMVGRVRFNPDGSNPEVAVEMLTTFPEDPGRFTTPIYTPGRRIQPPPEEIRPLPAPPEK